MNNLILKNENLININDDSVNEINIFNIDTKINNLTINIDSSTIVNYYEINTINKELNLTININKKHAKFNSHTLVVLNKDKFSTKQKVNHLDTNTVSNLLNYAIALKNAYIFFETIGKIENGKKNSNCYQLSKGIILSDYAKIGTKPILEIDEFDVLASHGASIGKMSDDELFYLMSRGLTKDESLKLIISGIINPIIQKLPEEIKNIVINKIHSVIGE